ncbi:MAG: HD domain-containing protein [Ruminiclostridium sp.]|nr:HD domain-containing protein [Ruminiclostridium sp.]
MLIFHLCVLVASLIISSIFFVTRGQRFSIYSVILYALIPVADLGYVLFELADDDASALFATKIIYFGGCYLSFYMMNCVVSFCGVKIPTAINCLMFLAVNVFYVFVITAGSNDLFYKSYKLVEEDGFKVLRKEYGPVHSFFYPTILLFFFVTLGVLIYCLLRKKTLSRRNTIILFISYIVAIFLFFGGRLLTGGRIELVGISHVLMEIVMLGISDRLTLYDIGGNVMETLMFNGKDGYISLDKRFRFLACNNTAKSLIPALNDLRPDDRFSDDGFRDNVRYWMAEYLDGDSSDLRFTKDGSIYRVSIRHLINKRKRVGYHITLEDVTREQKYIDLINNYNTDLREEVAAKTENIEKMHDNLILGMAMMVESRDNSTGGHIRRTSDCIKILIKHIRKTGAYELNDEFCRDLIKAAPMHDLGKIAVDDKILRKPGRFEPEEFEIMKTHAAKGAELITKILEETDDANFRRIAINVAHYHHERVDGTGYPDGLKGDDIPLESRIMAVVDVYDALVSKRCYKDSMSFDKAFEIIDEGMGRHFDGRLKESFISARPELEAYYS